MKVVIDPGHGGSDSGAVHKSIYEKNIALDYALMLGHFLRARGIDTALTRVDDRFIAVMDRADSVLPGDILVSCHVNSAASTQANGLSVWYHGEHKASKALAAGVFNAVISTGFLRKYGTGIISDFKRYPPNPAAKKRGGFGVLRESVDRKTGGAVMIELGFIKNDSDRAVITNTTKRNLMARAAAEAIASFIKTR